MGAIEIRLEEKYKTVPKKMLSTDQTDNALEGIIIKLTEDTCSRLLGTMTKNGFNKECFVGESRDYQIWWKAETLDPISLPAITETKLNPKGNE